MKSLKIAFSGVYSFDSDVVIDLWALDCRLLQKKITGKKLVLTVRDCMGIGKPGSIQ